MFDKNLCSLSACLVLGLASIVSSSQIEKRVDVQPFTFKEIYVPARDYTTPKTLYGRSLQLDDGTLLSTWENYSPEPPQVYFPIFRSADKGYSWESYSNVTDEVNGWGLRYQPYLYQLPQKIGRFPKGTVILAGSSIPTDLSITKIDIYASKDRGKTWSFISSVATGGKAIPVNGETPIWEPFLMVYNNELICYYTDQRDPAYGQKLVHQRTADGITWGPLVNDVRGTSYSQRPGMTTVAHLPNDKWLLIYEWGGAASPTNAAFPLYYRISDSPLTFDSAADQILVATDGTVPSSSPTIVWSPSGGVNGTLIVSANGDSGIFTNTRLGDPAAWVRYNTPQPAAYTRQVIVMDDPDYIHILSAGHLNGDNWVTNSVLRLPNLPPVVPSSSSTITTTSATSSRTTSPSAGTTSTKPPTCNRDNCFRALTRSASVASDFCATYTRTSDLTIATVFAGPCASLPSRVSSACSCVVPSAPVTSSA